MQQQGVERELSEAVRDNLTMINKGFVQTLSMRFHDSRERAQLAYADNLAETRRLMQLLYTMQQFDLRPDPDGDADRGGPDLQANAKDVWPSDLALATRRLGALQRGRDTLAASKTDDALHRKLDDLIKDAEAFVADLRDRTKGNEIFGLPDPAQTKSDAENNALDDFFGYVQGTEEAFLAGTSESPRPTNDPLFTVLNTLLCNHFLAIDQFFLHGFMLHRWGEDALAEGRIKHSVIQMNAAYRIAQRILVLGSVPKSAFQDRLRLPYRVVIGSGTGEALQHDLTLSRRLIDGLQLANELAEEACEPHAVAMLADLIETERRAGTALLDQAEQHASGHAPGKGTGKFDAMLKNWGAT